MGRDLDDVDRSILYLLQQDARNSTAQEIADTTGVSASTVRNRIDHLEDDGIIKGYHPEIDYEEANLPLQLTFIISAKPTKLPEFSEQIRRALFRREWDRLSGAVLSVRNWNVRR